MKTRKSDNPPSTGAPSTRSEALTWPIGAAFLIVLALTYVAGVWWMGRAMAVQSRQAEVQNTEGIAQSVASALDPLLATGDLSAARRLLTETAYQNDLDVCQLSLADGRLLIDADLSRPQLEVVPVSWKTTSPPVPVRDVVAGRVIVDQPVLAMGRGEAKLTIEKTLSSSQEAFAAVAPGAGIVGVLGLVGMLLIYRQIRSRLQTLNLIRNALVSASRGEESAESALLDPRMGREAAGWNRLLKEKQLTDEAEQSLELEQLSQVVGGGGALEAACDAMWHGLLVLARNGQVIYANGAAASMLDANTREELLGSELASRFPHPEPAKLLDEALQGAGPARVATHYVRHENGIDNHFRLTLRRMTANDQGGLLVLIEDATQQKIAELSQHDFIARATHELRSPLTNIRMYVETAQDEGENNTELRGECLNVIARESQRLERLVGEMLSVSEIEAGSQSINRDDVRLDAVFKELQSDYAAKAKDKRIALTFDLPPKMPVIRADREKLDVVFQNLLGNALKYTEEQGEVRFVVEISATELVVEVIDSGIGISEEDLPRVFDKFYRANDARLGEITGSGLGLALAQEIVRLHGGDLTVTSELNAGSTFRMALPIRVEGV